MSVRRLGISLWVLAIGVVMVAACSSPSPAPVPTFVHPTVLPPTAAPASTPEPTQIPSVAPPSPSPTLVAPIPTVTSAPAIPTHAIVIEATATLGSCDFRLEVADTSTERSRGLMEREAIPIDQGMLFVFGFQQELNFWMKNTLIPLDIVFLNDALQVVDVQTMVPEHEIAPEPLPFYTSAAPAKFAVEVNAGVAAECGISPGLTMSLTYFN